MTWKKIATKPAAVAPKPAPAPAPKPVLKVVPKPAGPRWLVFARTLVGQKEIKGPKHNSVILRMWEAIKRPYRNDETPWCAACVGYCLEESGIRSTRSEAARSYQNWDVKLDKPVVGCVVVFWRGNRNGFSGHVGFVVGVQANGNLLVLGGNQGDQVSIRAFTKDRVLSYRWPAGEPLPVGAKLEVSKEKIAVSINEA